MSESKLSVKRLGNFLVILVRKLIRNLREVCAKVLFHSFGTNS